MEYRRTLSIIVLILLLSLLFSCRMDAGLDLASTASPAGLPADQILDVARSSEGPFAYETVLPVALNLTVNLFQQQAPGEALDRQEIDAHLIVASLWNAKGEPLYSGIIPAGGTLTARLSLPAAPQDVVLRLESPGYRTREVTIKGMVLYSEVKRVMSLLSESRQTGAQLSQTQLPDTDGDGVPDIYDVDPLDPEVAFQVRTPASGRFTVAFEDLYPVPGDADYNDFVAMYFLLENYKSQVVPTDGKDDVVEAVDKPVEQPIELILNLHGEATADDKVAGYSHKFGIVIDFPGYTALQVKRVYYDSNGIQKTDTQANVADRAVIWLFENTSKSIIGKTATFDIFFPKGLTRDEISIAPYDPVLYVLNTGKDIHMVGFDSLTGQTQSYMDANGYPWALLVPEDWKHPAECQYIGKAYPLFEEWRASKGAVAPYWYLYPASTGSLPGNFPPSQVTSTDSTELVAGSSSAQTFRLLSTDPDGDAVDFLSSPEPLALQGLYSLNADTGLVTFQPKVPEGDYLFYFWSVDEHGASNLATPYKATFHFKPYVPPPSEKTLSLAADINAGGSSNPAGLTVSNNVLYFSANNGATGTELWRYDDGGPAPVADIRAGSASSSPRYLAVFEGLLYFQANDGSGPRLFRTAGAGAERITNLYLPIYLTVFENQLFMGAYDAIENGEELWRYNSATGPILVQDLNPSGSGGYPSYLTVYNGDLYFQADDGNSGKELWRYDGGISLAADIAPASLSSNPSFLTVFDNKLYFRADDGDTGAELWRYDGAGAVRLTNLNTAGDSLSPSGMVVYNGALYFCADDGSSGYELWKYDGTSASRAADINPGAGDGLTQPVYLAVYDGVLYFGADDGTHGTELWSWNGSAAALVKDINAGAGSSNPKEFGVFNNKLYLQADDGAKGAELWSYGY